MLTRTFVLALAGLSAFSEAAPVEKRAGGKRGLAFKKNLQSKNNLFPGCNWGYTWEARVGDDNKYSLDGKEFVPMLHDGGAMFTGAWNDDVNKAIKAGAKNILSFNEPDEPGAGGACMPVADAVAKHKLFVQPIADKNKGVRIGSPSVTNGNTGDKGLSYLKNFLSGCSGCRIDFITAHWYNGGSVKDFQDHFTNMNKQVGGRKIWVTEFAAPDALNAAQKKQFMTDAMAWMDKTDFIERYAYFGVEQGLTSGNALSDLGKAYA
ncbi:glycoside hydrolase family 128 protein [Periconia macrospinosa]|uniref:Glycoside hydrolase family 128 protein n=1 Tax=Periconia macrospinosa TaxID=97972 RepID=A0A2V1ECB7_9PLEO|nr:glycoside hydrolase family 128 protein [Periconia macrospinosa]